MRPVQCVCVCVCVCVCLKCLHHCMRPVQCVWCGVVCVCVCVCARLSEVPASLHAAGAVCVCVCVCARLSEVPASLHAAGAVCVVWCGVCVCVCVGGGGQTYAQQLPVALETGAEILLPFFIFLLAIDVNATSHRLPSPTTCCIPLPPPVYCSHLTMSQARTTNQPPLDLRATSPAVWGSNSTRLLILTSAVKQRVLTRRVVNLTPANNLSARCELECWLCPSMCSYWVSKKDRQRVIWLLKKTPPSRSLRRSAAD